MFQAIIDFFRRLFGGKPKEPVKPPIKSDPVLEDKSKVEDTETSVPPATPDDMTDASELPVDTVITVTDETEPVIILPEEEETSSGTTGTDTSTEQPDTTPTEVGTDQPKHTPRYLWCLDNGHGKQTKGKRSPVLEDGKQFFEYEFNRDIVKRIIAALDEKGVKSFNVVPEVDTDNFLEGRVQRANSKKSNLPKLFVSVHANAAPAPAGKWSAPSIKGIETWFYHGSKKGQKLASIFQKHLIEKTGFKNRHIKSQASRQFYVLKNTSMTAVLTENGFYNNKEEVQELFKDKVRQKIADAHVAAIMEVEEKGIG